MDKKAVVTAIACGAASAYMLTSGITPAGGIVAMSLMIASIMIGICQPIVLVVAGAYAKLCGGDYVHLSMAGSVWIVAGAVWIVFDLLLSRPGDKNPRREDGAALLAVILVGYLALRSVIGDEVQYTNALIVSAIAALGVLLAVRSGKPALGAVIGAGATFIWFSWVFGAFNNADRYMGISGNPNGMVTGLAISLPFILGALRKKQHLRNAFLLATSGLAVYMSILSGSTQGAIALVGVAACGVVLVLNRAAPDQRYSLVIFPAIIGAVFYIVWLTEFELSEDFLTLSGRTEIFSDAWTVILGNPIVGTGQVHLQSAGILRNAHSAALSIGVLSGFLTMIVWVILLVITLARSDKLLREGKFHGAAGLVIVLVQGVQTIESDAVTWVIIVVLVSTIYGKSGGRSLGPSATEVSKQLGVGRAEK